MTFTLDAYIVVVKAMLCLQAHTVPAYLEIHELQTTRESAIFGVLSSAL